MNKIIIIAVGLAAVLGIALFLVWPQYQKLQAMNIDVEVKRANLQTQETYFSQVKETSAKLGEYSDSLVKISSALPKDPSVATLVSFLQNNSSQTGLILKKIVLGGTTAPAEGKKLRETQFIIQVSGSYQSLKDFLGLVETSARIIEVQNISIEIPPAASKESPTFTLDLKTTSY